MKKEVKIAKRRRQGGVNNINIDKHKYSIQNPASENNFCSENNFDTTAARQSGAEPAREDDKRERRRENRRWAFLEEDGQATVRAWYNKQTTDRKISPSWSSSSVSSKCLAKCSTSATLVVLNDDDDVGECTLITSTSIRQH